ncbi:MAG: zinc ribbon domain-containing protein [Butyrivibrio sp.]|nr:zinc ribbon domain-containing protein [Butyrivibrio sp.]
MMICPNCGAEIEKDVDRCPYCGYMSKESVERKYHAVIKSIKDKTEKKEKDPGKALVKGFFSGTRIKVITLTIIALLVVLFFVEIARNLFPSEQAYASAYKEIAGEELEKAYKEKDIEKMAKIYDKAYYKDRVSLYGVPHYEAAIVSSNYMNLKQCLEVLDSGEIDTKEAEEITYYCFYFYYEAYDDEDDEIFDPIRNDEIIPIITDRLGFTIEDMEGFRDKVMYPPHVDRTKIYKVTKKYYKNYK